MHTEWDIGFRSVPGIDRECVEEIANSACMQVIPTFPQIAEYNLIVHMTPSSSPH